MRMLDLFCGRWGWSKAFAKRGWECWGIDLVSRPLPAANAKFSSLDVLDLTSVWPFAPDFICASPPCEQFSVHGMRHFHPNPPYPELGIKLFNHTRRICEESGVPYVIENVRAAQQFVGNAVHHCGPFYLWGNAVPPLIPRNAQKKDNFHALPGNLREKVLKEGLNLREARNRWQQNPGHPQRHELLMTGGRIFGSATKSRAEATAAAATIPPELANTVADYAERLLEQRRDAAASSRAVLKGAITE